MFLSSKMKICITSDLRNFRVYKKTMVSAPTSTRTQQLWFVTWQIVWTQLREISNESVPNTPTNLGKECVNKYHISGMIIESTVIQRLANRSRFYTYCPVLELVPQLETTCHSTLSYVFSTSCELAILILYLSILLAINANSN